MVMLHLVVNNFRCFLNKRTWNTTGTNITYIQVNKTNNQ